MIAYIDPQSYRNLSIYDYNLLSNMEQDIHYFCSKYYDYLDLPQNIRKHNVFKYNKINNVVLKAISYMFSYIMLAFWIIRMKPDIVHVQWFRIERFDYIVLKIIKKITKTKIVFTAHNILPHNSADKYHGIYEKIYNFVDAIIVHTSDTKKKIVEKFNVSDSKIFVIQHGLLKINVDEKEYERLKPEFEQKYNLENKIVFTSLGEQSMYKGVDVIAEVWLTTPQLANNPKCSLLIVGKCKNIQLDNLNNIDNVVVDSRRISDEEFLFILRQTDVYLLTYRTISQSGAMLTALNEKVPILVTDVGGLTDPLKIAKVGWCVDKLTAEKLRQKMLEIIDNPENIEMIKNNQNEWNKIYQFYNWENISKQTIRLYHSLA